METWTTVWVAVIVALSTIGATWLQNRHSSGRFEKELARQREVENRQRRREVRSESLRKLAAELAIAATKYDRLVRAAYTKRNPAGITKEQAEKDLQEAVEDFNNYIKSGNLKQILFLQFDNEFEKQVDEILRDYDNAYFDFEHYFDELTATELGKSRDVLNRNKTRIREVQELINKKLEEL